MLSLEDSFSECYRLLRPAQLEPAFPQKGPLVPEVKRTKKMKALLPKPAERHISYRELQLRLPTQPWNLIEPLLTFRVDETARETQKLTAEIRTNDGDVVFR